MPRALLAALALAAASCHPAPSPAPRDCRHAPATAVAVTPDSYSLMAGDFTLVQVTTNHWDIEPLVRRIHLYATDSLFRYRDGEEPSYGAHPLAGWVTSVVAGTAPLTQSDSRVPTQPGILWTAGYLRIGNNDIPDGFADELTLLQVSPDGFWGTWTRDWSLAMPFDSVAKREPWTQKGYFCATRLNAVARTDDL